MLAATWSMKLASPWAVQALLPPVVRFLAASSVLCFRGGLVAGVACSAALQQPHRPEGNFRLLHCFYSSLIARGQLQSALLLLQQLLPPGGNFGLSIRGHLLIVGVNVVALFHVVHTA